MKITKAQKIAQKTNEINRCAKVTGLSYSKFSKISNIIFKQYPHKVYQDVAEDINELFNDPNLINIKDYSEKEIASFVIDLWKVIA